MPRFSLFLTNLWYVKLNFGFTRNKRHEYYQKLINFNISSSKKVVFEQCNNMGGAFRLNT